MSIRVITTSSRKGFDQYGRRMVKTFALHWPPEVRLVFYTEGFDFDAPADNIEKRALPEWFGRWKESHKDNPDAHGLDRSRNRYGRKHDFRRDCVRFAHKIAALTDAAADDCDVLIWCDADTLTHAEVTERWLMRMFPGPHYMAWLDRSSMYPECGFLMFRARMDCHRTFLGEMRDIYESNRVFSLPETHDSFVFQQVVRRFVGEGLFGEPHSLSGWQGRDYTRHPFVRSVLGECMDHLKGPRKDWGKTPRKEAGSKRREKYWRQRR